MAKVVLTPDYDKMLCLLSIQDPNDIYTYIGTYLSEEDCLSLALDLRTQAEYLRHTREFKGKPNAGEEYQKGAIEGGLFDELS